jgi:UDP-N-acetylglucosamine 2-epimerase
VAIAQAIARLYEPDFRASLATVRNPYGDGGASRRIVDVLQHHPLEGLLKKRFHDLPHTLPALD